MKVLNDFRCQQCGHITETLENKETTSISCEVCGGPAQKKIAAVKFQLDGTDPGYPTAYDKWAKDHEKAAKIS